MGLISYTIPSAGSTLNSVADPEISTALQTILTWANGNIDAVNLSALLAQAAGVNQSGQTVKGAVSIATSQTTSSATFTTLSTPDQVTGIVLPTNGLIAVQYQALWSVASGFATAALFIGSNQLQIQGLGGSTRGPQAQSTQTGTSGVNMPLFTFPGGLASVNAPGGSYSADVTTGQATGFATTSNTSADVVLFNVGTFSVLTYPSWSGGWCLIDGLPAGTYNLSVQFKTLGGVCTVQGRRLRAMALSFS